LCALDPAAETPLGPKKKTILFRWSSKYLRKNINSKE
jgi:hypothetical protein